MSPRNATESPLGWEAFGRQLGQPKGLSGQVIGQLMRIANRAPIALAIEALDLHPDDVALDLGCGPGSSVNALSKHCARVHGIDGSATMVTAAGRHNRRAIALGGVSIKQCDFTVLPVADRAIDKILAANVAYFWHRPATVIGELRRVLRPGGRIAIYVTDQRAMSRWRFASQATHRHFDIAGLTEMLTTSGLKRDNFTVCPVTCLGVPGLLATISG